MLRKWIYKTLYKQTRELYNINTDKKINKQVDILLSFPNNIVTDIAEMRNLEGDAHDSRSK